VAAKNSRKKRKCRKKVAYKTEKEAKIALHNFYCDKGLDIKMDQYKCKFCGLYHIGRKKIKKKPKNRR